MSAAAETVLAPYLEPDERLLWAGKPHGGVRFRLYDWYFVPFSIMWCCIILTIFWREPFSLRRAPFGLLFLMLSFACGGFWLRFMTDVRKRRRTFYGVTDRRIVIANGFCSQFVNSVPYHALKKPSLTRHRGERGTITFGPVTVIDEFIPDPGWPVSLQLPPAFVYIDEAQEVFDVVRQAQEASLGKAVTLVTVGNSR